MGVTQVSSDVVGGGGFAMGDPFLGTTTVVLVTVEGTLGGNGGIQEVRKKGQGSSDIKQHYSVMLTYRDNHNYKNVAAQSFFL